MFSFLTKRLAPGITSTFRSNALKITSLVSGARRLKCDTIQPFEKKCKMEHPKKKCEEPPCRPLEPCCPIDFTGCRVYQEDPCKIKPDCCGNERLARDPCNCKGARIWKKPVLKLQKMQPFLKSVWEYPADCCGNPCPELLPRFDTMYYEPTDKAKRQYQQTWVECPKVLIRKRRICCYDSTELPPICRRKKVDCPISACAFDSKKLAILCSAGLNKRCPTIKSVCCLRGRYPPRCHKIRNPKDCKKRCCPYPAYSECCCPCPNPQKETECICTRLHSCLIYRGLKRKLTYDLPPPLPAWPPKMIPAR